MYHTAIRASTRKPRHSSPSVLRPGRFRPILRAMKRISQKNFLKALEGTRRGFQRKYLAMYSSFTGGIVTDPVLMLIPVDDHIVHRGDGIFETFKCIDGSIYNMNAHLKRLAGSAGKLQLVPPRPFGGIGRLVVDTVRAAGRRDSLIRVLISRGSGGFGVSPYECPQAQLFIIVSEHVPSFMTAHPAGAGAVSSSIPVKPPFFAGIKACNYLPNVLMKKEAADAGVDFAVGFDERGCLAEGATENFGIVTRDGRLLFPPLEHILAGTTMLRAAELARTLVKNGTLKSVAFAAIPGRMLRSAAEILAIGTTPDVTAVVRLDDRPVGGGRPGPVQQQLNAMLARDMRENRALLTPVF